MAFLIRLKSFFGVREKKKKLHCAARIGDYDLVAKLLVSGQARLDDVDSQGRTPLDLAQEFGHCEVEQLLRNALQHRRQPVAKFQPKIVSNLTVASTRNSREETWQQLWFVNKELRFPPLPPSQIDLGKLGMIHINEWMSSVFKDPTGTYAAEITLERLGAYFCDFWRVLTAQPGFNFDDFLDVIEVHLGAACPICNAGLVGIDITRLGSMQNVRMTVILGGTQGFESINNGICPHCPSTSYILIWQGGGNNRG